MSGPDGKPAQAQPARSAPPADTMASHCAITWFHRRILHEKQNSYRWIHAWFVRIRCGNDGERTRHAFCVQPWINQSNFRWPGSQLLDGAAFCDRTDEFAIHAGFRAVDDAGDGDFQREQSARFNLQQQRRRTGKRPGAAERFGSHVQRRLHLHRIRSPPGSFDNLLDFNLRPDWCKTASRFSWRALHKRAAMRQVAGWILGTPMYSTDMASWQAAPYFAAQVGICATVPEPSTAALIGIRIGHGCFLPQKVGVENNSRFYFGNKFGDQRAFFLQFLYRRVNFARLKSLTATPWTISIFWPLLRTGKEQIKFFSMP